MTLVTETDVQNASRLAIQAAGGVAWRNNVGCLPNPDTGIPVRFGLGNDSAKLNEVFKTGDLVGLAPLGIFCMWECKKPGWRWTATARERAQWNAIAFVRSRHGRAGFVTHPDMAVSLMLGTGWGAYNAAA
jgi:hypothetical protein